jgi:hypothetical protein
LARAAWDVGKRLSSLWLFTLYWPVDKDLQAGDTVVGTFQFDTTYSTWVLTFLGMSIVSLGFSVALFLKSRAVKKIPTSLTTTIFSKTFNVFDPFSEHRSMFESDFFFLLTGLVVTLLVLAAFVEIIVTGLLVAFSISILCLGLMMISEATETYSTAKTLVKAVKRQTSFGQGDICLLAIVKKTIGRLSVYYVLLSVLFAALFFTMPYLFPALMSAFSQFIGLIISTTIVAPLVGPFAGVLLFALLTIAVFRAAGKAKAAFFGFLPSDLFQTDEIMAAWIYHERA